METFKTKDGKQIVYENGVAKVYDLKAIEAEKVELEASIATIPPAPTEKETLDWANANYPFFNREVERKSIQDRIDEISKVLEAK